MDDTDKIHILIVDDVPENIQIAAAFLKKAGYTPAFAVNGFAALKMVKNNKFDLILLDVMMPEMDGYEVCRVLKETPETSEIPVIFLTGKTDDESIVKGFKAGAYDYVTKPFSGEELIRRVSTHIDLYLAKRKLKSINTRLVKEIEDRKIAEKKYRSLFENAVQGIFQSTTDGKLLSVNPAYVRILGYDSEYELYMMDDIAESLYFDREDRIKFISDLLEKKVLYNYEIKMRRKDGTPVYILANTRLTVPESGFIEGIALDNTAIREARIKLKESEERFRYLAVHDNLTGLYNTRFLYDNLKSLAEDVKERESCFSIAFMDLDNFKHVVDTYGHLNGSRAIFEVAETLKQCLESPCYAVSYAGDEFVVVMPEKNKNNAYEKISEIRTKMKETQYLSIKGLSVHITACFGIAEFPMDAGDITDLLALADQALFNVKARGKDGIGVSR